MNSNKWVNISLKCQPEEKKIIARNAKYAGTSVSRYLVTLGTEQRLPAKRVNQILKRNAVVTQEAVNIIRNEIHKPEPDRDRIESVLKKVEDMSWEN